MLTNVISFKAGWQSTFHKEGIFPPFRGKGFQALGLPFLDNQLSMVARCLTGRTIWPSALAGGVITLRASGTSTEVAGKHLHRGAPLCTFVTLDP